jgi:hypothetical protein
MLAHNGPRGLAVRPPERHPVHVTRLSVANALAARRLAMAGGALAVSMLAHRVAVGDLDLTPATPVVWVGLLAMVAVVGPRRGFRPRGPLACLAAMCAAQMAVHLAMGIAPWAFGLVPHHAPGLALGPSALVAHAVAGIVLAAALVWLEGLLARATAIGRRLRRWLTAAPGRARGARARVASIGAPGAALLGAPDCRGPPALRSS